MISKSNDNNWRHRTIEALERHDFGRPDEAPTPLTRRCLTLCKVPLSDFTVEDLRLMIGQGFAPAYLIPLAIGHLREDIFAEGDLFPGDLLKSVLAVDPAFWKSNPAIWREVSALLAGREGVLAERGIKAEPFNSVLQ